MANGRLLVFTEADLQILRDVIRAYRAGILQPRRPSSRRVPQGPPPGFWARLKTEVGSGEYTARRLKSDAETDADTEADDLTGVWEVNGLEGLPVGAADVGAVVWVERDWSADEEEWRFAYESGVPPGTADWDLLVWDHTTDKAWEVLAKADADYKVLQRKSDDSIGWDWVRAH